ncbi:MAG: sn-glycerol-1-phosphate dehydrogenase [Nitrososphaerales archaeon]
MAADHLPVYMGDEAIPRLIAFCSERGLRSLALVADPNTYSALGRAVEEGLNSHAFDVRTVIVGGDDIGADEHSAYQVLLGLDKAPRTFVAVGSGTITDVARFVSHRSNSDFISLPTAASVDGYTSIGAPMIIDGAKITVNCQGPLAVFAHVPTLCAAPRKLTAAGFGDLIAKLTSVADWEIGHLVWDEPYDAEIARRARQAVWDCVAELNPLVEAECYAIEALFSGLIESGFCMLDFGETRPASGYEHHVSHFWETKLLREGRHSVFHGAKVGVAVLASAAVYESLRALSAEDVQERLRRPRPDPRAEEAAIRAAYGPMAEQVIANQQPFLQMMDDEYDGLRNRIVARWDEIRGVLDRVPPEAVMRGWLERLGGATTPEAIGLSAAEYRQGLDVGHYYRTRFSGKKLAHYLGV